MGRKYSRIKEAGKLQTELEAYIKFLTAPATAKTPGASGKSAAPKELVYVYPFAFAIPTGTIVSQYANTAAMTTFATEMGNKTLTALPSSTTVLPIKRYRAPRVNVITGRSATGKVATSHITAGQYLKYGGKAESIPFGKSSATATETVEGNFSTIKSGILTAEGSTSGDKVYLIPEKY